MPVARGVFVRLLKAPLWLKLFIGSGVEIQGLDQARAFRDCEKQAAFWALGKALEIGAKGSQRNTEVPERGCSLCLR